MALPDKKTIIGRFAPSPTGPLHLGSLYTALASFLQARCQQGRWLLRIDDLDTPRNRPGATTAILSALENLGLHWDGPIVYQSQHRAAYQAILDQLDQQHWLYRCDCSRKILTGETYSGRCRTRFLSRDHPHALRIKTHTQNIEFIDILQGVIKYKLTDGISDFIVKRKDHIIAYPFAVVIDDHLQQVNEIVRGCDLLTATPKQIYLQQLLGYPTPRYLHVPVLIDPHGYKLSKQTLATAVDTRNPSAVLFTLLELLKQQPPAPLRQASAAELLAWAIDHWQPAVLANQQTLPTP
ncbi:MAG: tRNA glutamyl-Q(34) synthetase GluQRS [Methylovulum sp.]|nr:tRNA glutamyl-Q(34) synthetase GluQRS [Methylovulum sp.]